MNQSLTLTGSEWCQEGAALLASLLAQRRTPEHGGVLSVRESLTGLIDSLQVLIMRVENAFVIEEKFSVHRKVEMVGEFRVKVYLLEFKTTSYEFFTSLALWVSAILIIWIPKNFFQDNKMLPSLSSKIKIRILFMCKCFHTIRMKFVFRLRWLYVSSVAIHIIFVCLPHSDVLCSDEFVNFVNAQVLFWACNTTSPEGYRGKWRYVQVEVRENWVLYWKITWLSFDPC